MYWGVVVVDVDVVYVLIGELGGVVRDGAL